VTASVNHRDDVRFAPGRWALALVLTGMALAAGVTAAGALAVPPRPGVTGTDAAPIQVVGDVIFLGLTPVLGAFLLRKRPDNVIGWLFIHAALWLGVGFLGDTIGRHAPPTMLTGGIATVVSAMGGLAFLALLLLFQVFPTGRLPTPRWRLVSVVTWAGALLIVVSTTFQPEPFQPPIEGLPTPLAGILPRPIVELVGAVGTVLFVAALIGSVALVVFRFRRSTDIERQQIKWFAWASSIVLTLLIISLATNPHGAVADTFWVLTLSSIALLPIASTLAILRYRLWDIDRIVSRTVSYAAVTALLVGVFALVNVALGTVLASVTQSGTVAVAVSTLAVFALFQPLRGRIHGLVDRRFDRARVDADRSAAAFAARLRDEIDLTTIAAETARTVEGTLHPAFTSVWLREPK
jgi:hypothetical protein